ncbi:hypothetical protein BWQ96_07973 [Gracilariopsis chorda]|uniref:Uncharacterized protein n=1 Tax=Gracilariopsis chorda TaxID=448386 RepID=A0A2V3IJI3_9FLOR|nr:hypothetical protein BWQ96_07973 [Gracilariopsis chorda]|eukprot:PXF42254.1 hypothetical protein BWQ96_07973 [Gracilariopsis chorda]
MSSTKASEVIEGPFQGAYGNWYLTRADVTDVQVYRAALGVVCVAQSACILLAIAQAPVPSYVYDALFVLGTGAFGVALSKIHIYMKPLHTALKFLWVAGLLGAIAILATEHALVPLVYEKPVLLLATGWQFVALTGVFIKEAFCFGRAEAIGLTALIPVLLGGHFLGILPDSLEQGGGLVFVATFLYFCWRKFTQGVKDDVGDLSVFQYLAKNANQ